MLDTHDSTHEPENGEKGRLVLTRKLHEKIYIGSDITITVVELGHNKVRLQIEAPQNIDIHREEVRRRIVAGIMCPPCAPHCDPARHDDAQHT